MKEQILQMELEVEKQNLRITIYKEGEEYTSSVEKI